MAVLEDLRRFSGFSGFVEENGVGASNVEGRK
jgi:hypothetical protein